MNSTEMKALVEKYIAAYNSFDIEGMLALVHPNVEFKNVAKGAVNAQATGMDAFRRLAEQSKGLFSARKQTMTSFQESGDRAVITVTFRAVLAVDLSSGMKQDHELNLSGRSEFTFRDGKIVRIIDES